LASRIAGFPANRFSSHWRITSVGRLYIHATKPSANMFFARSASFLVMPSMPFAASSVIVVIGTSKT
jgi:hypothetical protein